LEEERTNNQVEYEALLFGLEFLESMGVKHVEVYGDSTSGGAASIQGMPMLQWIFEYIY